MLRALLLFGLFLFAGSAPAGGNPVYIGLDAEIGHRTSTSDDAILAGMHIAVREINAAGGVLGGRPLKIITRDNRSVPARGIENIRRFAATPDLVAVFCSKFSPVVLEELPLVHRKRILLLDPWAAADAVTENRYHPNYVFRLSLRDSWAMPVMLEHARAKGLSALGVLLPNTAWGRSNQHALLSYVAAHPGFRVVGIHWYNWGDNTLLDKYTVLREAGARALILVANELEGSILVKEVAALAPAQRLPIISHWGITGGDFVALTDGALHRVDLSMVQTFSFVDNRDPRAEHLAQAAVKLLQAPDVAHLESPVGIAQAYDLTHLLALAIARAGSIDRAKVRDAMEQLPAYDGVVRRYDPPFTPERHDALGPEDVFMATYRADGTLAPVAP